MIELMQNNVKEITDLHRELVIRWHKRMIDNPNSGLLGVVCQQHCYNFQLWHEEDIARSPDVGDRRIAQVKRAIDGFNQQRNDWIEKIDNWLSEDLQRQKITPVDSAPLNTETPGSMIDRLSILSLRIYHMEEQALRTDVTPEQKESVAQKLALCLEQHDDFSGSLAQLLADIFTGRKRHKTYRQMKMYNDPSLKEYLYKAQRRLAG